MFDFCADHLRIVNVTRKENQRRNMALDQPKLIFKQLKGFQAIDDGGKIKTFLFLNAAQEVVSIIGELLLLFTKLFILLDIQYSICKQKKTVSIKTLVYIKRILMTMTC